MVFLSLFTQMLPGHRPDRRIQVCHDIQHGRDPNHIGVHIVGVHHRHRVPGRVVVLEIELMVGCVVHDVVQNRNSSGFVERLHIGRVSVVGVLARSQNRQVLGQDVLDDLFAHSSMPEAQEPRTSEITFESKDMLTEFVSVGF
jgi:hypothetical protein